MRPNPTQSLEDWMREVDDVIGGLFYGMTTADLPDVCYRDWYDDDVTPLQAARRAIRNAHDE